MDLNPALISAMPPFQRPADPSLQYTELDNYLKQADLRFEAFGISDDTKKKSWLRMWGGKNLENIYTNEANITSSADLNFEATCAKLRAAMNTYKNDKKGQSGLLL